MLLLLDPGPLQSNTSPPLKYFNELLRLIQEAGDTESAFKLLAVMDQCQMHYDAETQQRLHEIFSYFPRTGSDTVG
jgi:hypothetical protein